MKYIRFLRIIGPMLLIFGWIPFLFNIIFSPYLTFHFTLAIIAVISWIIGTVLTIRIVGDSTWWKNSTELRKRRLEYAQKIELLRVYVEVINKLSSEKLGLSREDIEAEVTKFKNRTDNAKIYTD